MTSTGRRGGSSSSALLHVITHVRILLTISSIPDWTEVLWSLIRHSLWRTMASSRRFFFAKYGGIAGILKCNQVNKGAPWFYEIISKIECIEIIIMMKSDSRQHPRRVSPRLWFSIFLLIRDSHIWYLARCKLWWKDPLMEWKRSLLH